MNRREFITFLGSALAMWLLATFVVCATLSSMPAAAGGVSATSFHGGAYYRALLLNQPPPYWNGGTVWPPANVYVYTPQPADSVRSAPPSTLPRATAAPKVLRVPDAYVEAAHGAKYPGPLWVKTTDGFRFDTAAACSSATRWERTPYRFRSIPGTDCN